MARNPTKTEKAIAKSRGIDLRTKRFKQFVKRRRAARKSFQKKSVWIHTYGITFPERKHYYSFTGRRFTRTEPKKKQIQYFRRRVIQKLRKLLLKDSKQKLWFSVKGKSNEEIKKIKISKEFQIPRGYTARETYEDERSGTGKSFLKKRSSKRRTILS